MNIIIKRINENYDRLSPNHKFIADYILENHKELPNMTARELASHTLSVPSSIISFSKKIGYKGFNELKFHYENDKFNQGMIEKEILEVFYKVNEIVQRAEFDKAVEVLKKSSKIFIIASQMSQIPAKDFYFRMRKIEPSKMIFFESFSDQLRMASLMEKSDVALIVSNSGEAQEALNMQDELIKKGCKQVLVTNMKNSSLSKYATVELSIGFKEQHPVLNQEVPTTARYALIAILEKIYLEFLNDNFDENIKRIKHASKLYKD